MANRALQGKMERNKIYRDRKAGRHARFHGWTFEETEEKEEREGRALPMPTSAEVKHAERVAIEACNLKVKRVSCTGTMPVGVMGKTMRKARHAPVQRIAARATSRRRR
jgi:hypothetical protein